MALIKINTGKRIPPPAPLLALLHCTRNNVASLFFISVMMTPTESPFFFSFCGDIFILFMATLNDFFKTIWRC